MTDDAFLAAILATPGDTAPRLIYADWLAGRGGPRTDAVRAQPELGRVVAALLTEKQAPLRFGADAGWGRFYDVAWDVELVAIRPDRRSLAVLAADTD